MHPRARRRNILRLAHLRSNTARLHDEIVRALKLPDVGQRLAGLGLDTVGSSQHEFGEFIKAELVKWARIARASGAKVEQSRRPQLAGTSPIVV